MTASATLVRSTLSAPTLTLCPLCRETPDGKLYPRVRCVFLQHLPTALLLSQACVHLQNASLTSSCASIIISILAVNVLLDLYCAQHNAQLY